MLLITMREWLGPGRRMSTEENLKWKEKVRHSGFVTRLPLGEAIERIKQYSDAYKARYPLAVEFELISVSEIDYLTDEQIEISGAVFVEKLAQRVEDFH